MLGSFAWSTRDLWSVAEHRYWFDLDGDSHLLQITLLLLLLLLVVVVVVVVSNCFVPVWELVLRQRKGAPVFLFTSIYNIYIYLFIWFYLYIQFIHSASPWIATKWWRGVCVCVQVLFNLVVDTKYTQHLNIYDDQMSRFSTFLSGNYVAPAMADAGELVRLFSAWPRGMQLLKH